MNLSTLFPNASPSFLKMNAGASASPAGALDGRPITASTGLPKSPKAVRQKRAMNKAESMFHAYLVSEYGADAVKHEGVTWSLANGVKYTPDFTVRTPTGHLICYEVKAMRGNRVHVEDDAAVKVKCAAHEWGMSAAFIVAWFNKSAMRWEFQTIQP